MTKPNENGFYTVSPSDSLYGHFRIEECAIEQGDGNAYEKGLTAQNWQDNEIQMALAISRIDVYRQLVKEAEKLLEAYKGRRLMPPDKFPAQWQKLEELIEAAK